MNSFLLRAAFAAIGHWLASLVVDGLRFESPWTLLGAGLLLGVVNAVVRPLAVVLTFPLTLVTLGLFLLVINAAMVGLVAWFLPGMQVAGFWPALFASLVVAVVSWVGHALRPR